MLSACSICWTTGDTDFADDPQRDRQSRQRGQHKRTLQMTPLLSVVMPVWNGERHLAEAVESILRQSFFDFEFIVLDDGSTDSTPKILREFSRRDTRIRVIALNHEGIVHALNRGIAEARASWIARMDCDDIAHPARFEKQMQALSAYRDAILCHTGVRLVGDPALMSRQQRLPRTTAFLAVRLCFGSPIIHPGVVYSKTAVLKAGGYRPEERHAEDYSLWGRMLALGRFVGLPESLLDLRVHAGSISKKEADTQSRLTAEIAQRHCRQFMRLPESDAARAYNALRNSRRGQNLREWFWFISHCLPRMRWQSAEMWAWAGSQTLRRLLKPDAQTSSCHPGAR